HLAFFDRRGQSSADGGLAFFGDFPSDVSQENRVPQGGGHLSNPRSHLPSSHDADLFDIHGSSFSCSCSFSCSRSYSWAEKHGAGRFLSINPLSTSWQENWKL